MTIFQKNSLIQSFINKSIVALFLDHLNSTYIEIFHFKQIGRCCNTMNAINKQVNSREFFQSTFTYFGIRSIKNAQALGSFCGYRGTDYVKQKKRYKKKINEVLRRSLLFVSFDSFVMKVLATQALDHPHS